MCIAIGTVGQVVVRHNLTSAVTYSSQKKCEVGICEFYIDSHMRKDG